MFDVAHDHDLELIYSSYLHEEKKNYYKSGHLCCALLHKNWQAQAKIASFTQAFEHMRDLPSYWIRRSM